MGEGNIFGSGELTPDLVRGATFTDHDGRYDAAEVHMYLDRIATAIGVFMSADAPTALRAEFARNAEIAQQVLDAGQAAAEQLKRQATEEAQLTAERTHAEAEALRDGVLAEIASSRAQVSELRGQFIQDLRDLYDRIGASLYRFERAVAEEESGPIDVPSSGLDAEHPAHTVSGLSTITDTFASEAEPPLMPSVPTHLGDRNRIEEPSFVPAPEPSPEPAPTDDGGLGDGGASDVRPPAYAQLPAEAWTSDPPLVVPVTDMELGDPFEPVVEDEPLQPGEPLVDLRGFLDLDAVPATEARSAEELAAAPGPEVEFTNAPASHGESVFTEYVELPMQPEPVTPPGAEQPFAAPTEPAAPAEALPAPEVGTEALVTPAPEAAPAAPAPAPTPSPVPAAPAAPAEMGGGWLDGPTDPIDEDARAEALLAGTAGMDHPDAPPAAPTPGPLSTGAASPDALAVRQLILDSIAAGQPRASIEQYLTEQLGLLSPGTLIDAAINGG